MNGNASTFLSLPMATKLKSGHTIVPFVGESKRRYHATYHGYQTEHVRLQPGGCVMPRAFSSLHESIYNFEFSDSDVVILTYPKCGTTWMQEVVWTMRHNPDLDNAAAKGSISIRSPHLEFDTFVAKDVGPPIKFQKSVFASAVGSVFNTILKLFPPVIRVAMYLTTLFPRWATSHLRISFKYFPSHVICTTNAILKEYPEISKVLVDLLFHASFLNKYPIPGILFRICENMQKNRIIKTHLPFSLLPKEMLDKVKVIFVTRNPKDMLVSYYHHCRLLSIFSYTGSFTEFVESFMDGDLTYGNYALHLREYIARKDHPNLMLVRYEDMKADPIAEMKKINEFIGTRLTDQQMEKVANYTSFPEMKKRDNMAGPSDSEKGFFNTNITKTEAGFFRKGETGDWKSKFSPELEAKLDQWIKQNLDTIDMDFKYSI